MNVRIAGIADTSGIVAVLRASICELCHADHGNREVPLQAWLGNKTAENVEAWIRDPTNLMVVGVIGLHIAGVGCLRADGTILLNYVAPSYRFLGVSKAILAFIEAHALRSSIVMLKLHSTKTAIDIYRAAGFIRDGEPTMKHGLLTYPMAKMLLR